MTFRLPLITLIGLVVVSCAQVPKESVELSATIGRDLVAIHTSHRELAHILFSRMRHDVNRFVDNVFAPFQIRTAMDRQKQLATSSSQEDQRKSLLLAINAAFKPDAPAQLQDAALKGMGITLQKIRADVESMRKELLAPLDAQEQDVLDSIDRAYQQLRYANSIVTGHLSSVAKVHETQAQLLKAVGVEQDLQKEVSKRLAATSDKIGALVEAAETADDKLKVAEESAKSLKNAVRELGTSFKGN